ncbi:MAG TPA: hypothetical protein VII99_10595 [Bacteroidia bacterium]
MTIQQILKRFEEAKDEYKLACLMRKEIQKSVGNPFSPTDEEAAKLYLASKCYKAACRKFYIESQECRTQMILLLKRGIGPSKKVLEEVMTDELKKETFLNSPEFEQYRKDALEILKKKK